LVGVGFPVAQACPCRAAPSGSRWSATPADLDGDPDADPPTPPSLDVWRSVRVSGDTKTKKSRRTLGLAKIAVAALRRRQVKQAQQRESGRVPGGRTPGWCSGDKRSHVHRWDMASDLVGDTGIEPVTSSA